MWEHYEFFVDYFAAAASGCEASFSLSAETAWRASIHFGELSLSSSGRLITKAATRRPPFNHHVLKLLLVRSPRWTTWSASDESPQYSYERSKTSEKK